MTNYFIKYKNYFYTKPYLKGDKNNILVIGDVHAPFTLKTYLQFVRHQQELFNCGTVIFIGDIVDFHYSSFHIQDPDGLSAGDEAKLAKSQLQEWYKMFPEATVTIGNHDLIIYRKMFANGLSRQYAKNWNDLFDAPKTWKFVEQTIINNVLYTHGVSNALKRMTDARISVVQGHLHSLGYIQHSQSEINRVFAMQVGCGIDDNSFAFGYNKGFNKKSVISCGVILNKGILPIIIPH
jgi:hypothetical protein